MSAPERRRLKRIRDAVIARDGLICCYCNKELILESVTMEHIVPESKRGTYNTTNLTVSCSPCNNKRGDKPFFEFAKQFNFSDEKTEKYKRLYYNNLKIKILNIAKEELLDGDVHVPENIISEACKVLKIRPVSFQDWQGSLDIQLNEMTERKKIKFNLEKRN